MNDAPRDNVRPLLEPTDAAAMRAMVANIPVPSLAVIFHTSNGDAYNPRASLRMVTAHPVTMDDNGVPQLCPGRPLSPSDERSVLDLLMGRKSSDVEILPPTVLARRDDMTMWWLPPQVRPMHLRLSDGRYLAEDRMWPNLVALVSGRTLFLAAVKGGSRPTASSLLHHAPLGNIYGDTRVCTGTCTLPFGSELACIAEWDAVIFNTAFTHDNHDSPIAPAAKKSKKKESARGIGSKREATNFWASSQDVSNPFPDARLVPLGMALGDWFKYATQGTLPDGRMADDL